ncbi:hypothetical protein J6590_019622 [Homalodisca vitripennis]|nr:hypothetical protein J6590_019622 [Homalodisca vitripennis]
MNTIVLCFRVLIRRDMDNYISTTTGKVSPCCREPRHAAAVQPLPYLYDPDLTLKRPFTFTRVHPLAYNRAPH